MKFSLEFGVDSNTTLPGEVEIKHEDRRFIFYPDDKGMFSRIKIIAEVKNPEAFYSIITPTPKGRVKAHINIKTDMELYNSVIKDFQDLESFFALKYSLRGINWSNPKRELIFDTEEERRRARIYTWEYGPTSEEPKNANREGLEQIILHMGRLSSQTVYLSIYREGDNDFKAQKFISAFYNFYFIMEGMYGNGKTKNIEVAKEFKKSKELREILQSIIDNHIKISQKHFIQTTKMLQRRNMTLGVDALIELIVRTRGDLHHFQNNPNRPQPTPFRHSEYESIAFITLGVALHSILYKIADINQAHKAGS
ncbi:MAG TPA: hypothetical protein VF553_02380 [Pyrinomonadaceae bacterium]